MFVCENPTVVAAVANRLGAASAPLVCTEGYPRTAARLLLAHLGAEGMTLRYHGDFDWDGIQMGNLMVERHGALPWRFRTSDYVFASPTGGVLEGAPVTALWDEALEPAMREGMKSVHEEQVMDTLIEDLVAGALRATFSRSVR